MRRMRRPDRWVDSGDLGRRWRHEAEAGLKVLGIEPPLGFELL
jgi:hypothetical protein